MNTQKAAFALFKIVHRGLIICIEIYIIAPTHMISKAACIKKKKINILIFYFFLMSSKNVQLQPLFL